MKTITFRRSLLIALTILLFGAFSFPSSGLANLEEGLVGCWRFNEGSGSIAYDETYNHNDGTIRGASWTNGILEDALYFHGGGQFFDGDRVLVPHSSSLDITGELTITAWINATGTDNYLAIVDKYHGPGGTPPDCGFTLYLAAGKLRFTVYSGSNGTRDCYGTSELRDSCWHHVAGVCDGSYIRVYVDGQKEGEVTWDFPPASTTNDLGIGERPCGWGGFMPFLGVIDEVRIYNRALSDAEIWGRTLDRTVDLTPYFDWGAISSYPGLAPPGFMGIWSPSHSTFFYFPSDTMAPANPPTTPRAWLIPGVHLATFFGPDNAFIPTNPMVTVLDRNSKPCSLFVQIPPQNLIDQAIDLNVIQVSSGESKTISISDTVETMVFLANCDGAGYCSPDQPLEVWMNYQDGTKDTVVFENIHPAERSNNIASLQYTIYCNEVFGCGPFYCDLPSPYYTDAHSEFWHWYALYPNNNKFLTSIIFVGIQGGWERVFISALSYNKALPPEWGEAVDNPVILSPYFDWGAISSHAGLAPPGFMGIWSPSHSTFFYFPSDTMAPANPPTTPRAWLIPGVHLATFFGPDNAFIPTNPMVTVLDRNFNPCSLCVIVPPQSLIDQATDSNVIQISSGETKTISINDTVETMVFLANCDGAGYCSPDQPLEVWMNYQDGTKDTVVFENIHPAERSNNIASLQYTIYCNEVFGCGPFYCDLPYYYTDSHSEFWHWYTLYPNTNKFLNSITFVGIQSGVHSEIHISAISRAGVFIRGDVNTDGVIELGDVVYLINYLFKGGPPPDPLWTGDVNCDGVIDIGDVVYLINYLFKGGPPPCDHCSDCKLTISTRSRTELYKGKPLSQIGFSSSATSKGGKFEAPVMYKSDVDIAAVQLEIRFDPEEVALLEPALTPRTEGLTIYSSSNEGIQKIGILNLSGEHCISAGTGAVVTLRGKASDLSSLEITRALLVDRDAHKIPVNIVPEMKKSEEDFIAEKSSVPQDFSLWQNYPNPFNPETEIKYALPQDCDVKLIIYNILGKKVKVLLNKHQIAGFKTVHWDGKDEKGDKVASGVYFYRLEADKFSEVRKMLLVK